MALYYSEGYKFAKNGHVHKHNFHYFGNNFWSLVPKLWGRTSIMICKQAAYRLLVCECKKIDVAPIFGVSRINAKLWHCSRALEIGLASIFLFSNTSRWCASLLHSIIHDCLRNMGAEFPIFRILHANPCLNRMHPKMGCVLREHGFGWQIRNTGSSAPILRL